MRPEPDEIEHERGPAIVLAFGDFGIEAKTTHGLLRSGDRFEVVAVINARLAGADAGEAMDGVARGIPIYASVKEALSRCDRQPEYCVIGVASHGGVIDEALRAPLLDAVEAGLTIVNGLHQSLQEDPEISAAARKTRARILDIRTPRPASRSRFWTGAIDRVRAPRLAVLGTDCAVGKRTTAKLLVDACCSRGIRAEMIYTGQTGWMQGLRHGLMFDATPNDFVTGELEAAIVACDEELSPDLILLEGQSSLRNPAGPCGPEFLVSAGARAVILQHAPGRRYFIGFENLHREIPPVEEELRLIALYGSRTLAVTLSGEGLSMPELEETRDRLARELGLPVVCPLQNGVESLIPEIQAYLKQGSS